MADGGVEAVERALLLLEDQNLSCSEVAFLLGYAEPATFFRAFKRWMGTSAEMWRKGVRSEVAG